MYLAGLAVFAVASLLCGFAPGVWVLIAFRVFQGVGAAFLMTLSMALMREAAGKERMGRAMGLLGTVSALGTALGPSLGGALIPVTGWRGVFLVLVPLALLALGMARAALPASSRRQVGPKETIWAMLDMRILPNLIVNVLVAAVMMTTLVVGPFYLGSGVGLTEAVVGLVMSVGPIVAIICGVPAGRGVDAWGVRLTLGTGLAMLATGAFLLSVLPAKIGVAGYVLAIVVLTPGYQLFQAANNTAALADVPEDRRGIASGLLALSRNIGLIAGASGMGAVFILGTGTHDIAQATPAAIADGMRLTFLLAAGMIVLAILVACRAWGGKPIQDAR
jgi:MFS family permease